MKQTAVEWLENEVYKAIENTSENSISFVLEKLFQQAKEMEKEQSIDLIDWLTSLTAKKLYSEFAEDLLETFKQQEQ
jgi:hypothetical protein